MKNIKKSDIFLILGLILVLVLGFFIMKGEKFGDGGTFELTYDEYIEKVNSGDKFVLVVESATCSHCINYMPVVKNFARSRDLKIYYVDTSTFTSENWETFEDTNSFLIEKKEEGWGTPTTLFLDGKTAVDYLVGTTTAEVLETYLDKYPDYFEKVESDE